MIDHCFNKGVRDKRTVGTGGRVTSHRSKDQSSTQRLLQPGEDMEAVVADALVSGFSSSYQFL